MPREAAYPLLLGLAAVWAIWALVNLISGAIALGFAWIVICAIWAGVGLRIRAGGDAELDERELYLSIGGIALGVGFILAIIIVFITR